VPFFSVIVSTYNRAESLLKVIGAILNQSFADFELLIVDDCSIDHTAKIINEIADPRIRFFKTHKNSGGPAVPRNIGIDSASAPWVCFCDSDDFFLPGHLLLLHDFINSSKLTDGIISTNAYLIKNGIFTKELYFKETFSSKISFLSNWKSNKAILSSLCMANSNIIPFRKDKNFQSVEDYLFVLDNMINGKAHYYLPVPSIYYNVASSDSLRVFNTAGSKLHVPKTKLFSEYALWKYKNGFFLASIIFLDFVKFNIRKIVKPRVPR
jgi:glycosyltransferase involved in cell wall biosynthesis